MKFLFVLQALLLNTAIFCADNEKDSEAVQLQQQKEQKEKEMTISIADISKHARRNEVKNYNEFHSDLYEESKSVLSRVSKDGQFSFSGMQKYQPIQEMFHLIGVGSNLIEKTKNLRKKVRLGKTNQPEEPKIYKNLLETPNSAITPNLNNNNNNNNNNDFNFDENNNNNNNQQKESVYSLYSLDENSRNNHIDSHHNHKNSDPFSVESVINLLQGKGVYGIGKEVFSHHHHHKNIRHNYRKNNKKNYKNKIKSFSHSHSHKKNSKVDVPESSQRVEEKREIPISVYSFLEESSTLESNGTNNIHHHNHNHHASHKLSPQEILQPNKKPDLRGIKGSRPSEVSYDSRSSQSASSMMGSLSPPTGSKLTATSMILPLLTLAISSSSSFSSPFSSDSTVAPDPFATKVVPQTDRCYSMEEQWINQCSSPPQVYLGLETVTQDIKSSQRKKMDNHQIRKMMAVEAIKAFSKDNENFQSSFLQTVLSEQGSIGDAVKGLLNSQNALNAISSGTTQDTASGSFNKMMKNLFSGVNEALTETLVPDDSHIAAAYSTEGIKGMMGMAGDGLGAMFPVMGGVNPTSANAMIRNPDYYDPTSPDGPEPSEMQVSGAEKCDRLLNTWTFKCAIVPM